MDMQAPSTGRIAAFIDASRFAVPREDERERHLMTTVGSDDCASCGRNQPGLTGFSSKATREDAMTKPDRKTGQPEALATFAASAGNDGRKPDSIGLGATPETAGLRTSNAKKVDAATRVLQEGVTGRDRKADEAIDALPDRTARARR
jgi:hypothetical protein